MTRPKHQMVRWLAAGTLIVSAAAQAQTNEFVQIPLNGPIEYVLPDGNIRMLDPSCSNGPMRTENGIEPADPQYSFLMQMNDPEKLLIFMDGGGACWDALTCVGSPLIDASTYTQYVDETPADAEAAGGIFDANNPDNPYLNYTKVFVPYCSGDVHWGSRDTTYTLEVGPINYEWTIRHRGTDNFLAVLHWLRTEGVAQGLVLENVRNLSLAGASAGAYGTAVAFPYIAELAPNARLRMIADAGIGVINKAFYKLALYDPAAPDAANWGVVNSLPTFMGLDENFLAAFAEQPLALVPAWFAELARYRPRSRLAMITSNLDLTQVGFYALMEALNGRPPNDPALLVEWYYKMQLITGLTEGLPNYRSFIEDGTYHTILGDDSYYVPGASGVAVRDWNEAMITIGTEGWDNIDVGPPF